MSAGLTKVNGHTAQQGDSFLPAASRVHQGWQLFCFLLLIVAPSGVVYMYDKNHYNKFCHLPNCKAGKVQDSFFPFPTLPLFTSLPPPQQQLIMAFILLHCQNQTLRFAPLAAN